MKLLMLMRDALPPARVDVAVLFDRALRERGIQTDFAGPAAPADGAAGPANTPAVRGAQFDIGTRQSPACAWRLARLAWQRAPFYDLLVVRDLPLAGMAVALACALRARPWAYWMSFPMPLGDRQAARLHRRQGRPLRAAVVALRGALAARVQDHWLLPRAAHVFVQSEAMRTRVLLDAPGLPAARVSAVPMGVDAAALPPPILSTPRAPPSPRSPGDPGGLRSRNVRPGPGPGEGENAPVIAYLGSLDAARRLEVLIDALELLHRSGRTARLRFVGAAPRTADVDALRAHAGRLGLASAVEFTGALPMAQAWQRLADAAVAVAAVPPGELHDVSSPTKVVEYLALGLPVVASRIPDQVALLAVCGGGVCVDHAAGPYAAALAQVLDDLPAARAAARAARPRVLALRDYAGLSERVAAVLRALVPSPGGPVTAGAAGATR